MFGDSGRGWPNTWILALMAVGCAALAVWIVYLSIKLPSSYHAENWDVAWIGFDTALLGSLIATTIAMFKHRTVVITFATISATLMFTDAWFDIVTSRTGTEQLLAIGTAVLIEIPIAIALATFSHRRITATLNENRKFRRSSSQQD